MKTRLLQVKMMVPLLLFLSLIACINSRKSSSASSGINPYQYTVQKRIVAENGAVVSAHPLASKLDLLF